MDETRSAWARSRLSSLESIDRGRSTLVGSLSTRERTDRGRPTLDRCLSYRLRAHRLCAFDPSHSVARLERIDCVRSTLHRELATCASQCVNPRASDRRRSRPADLGVRAERVQRFPDRRLVCGIVPSSRTFVTWYVCWFQIRRAWIHRSSTSRITCTAGSRRRPIRDHHDLRRAVVVDVRDHRVLRLRPARARAREQHVTVARRTRTATSRRRTSPRHAVAEEVERRACRDPLLSCTSAVQTGDSPARTRCSAAFELTRISACRRRRRRGSPPARHHDESRVRRLVRVHRGPSCSSSVKPLNRRRAAPPARDRRRGSRPADG